MLSLIKSWLIVVARLLPSRVRGSLFHFAYSFAPEEFERFSYLYGTTKQNYVLRAISSRGFSPITIVDVGAYKGEWTRMAKSIWPLNCHVIMIEPNLERREQLTSPVGCSVDLIKIDTEGRLEILALVLTKYCRPSKAL